MTRLQRRQRVQHMRPVDKRCVPPSLRPLQPLGTLNLRASGKGQAQQVLPLFLSMRTNADKRRAVSMLLEDEEWAAWSDREIARRCSVVHQLVGKIRAGLSGVEPQGRTQRTGLHARHDEHRASRAAWKLGARELSDHNFQLFVVGAALSGRLRGNALHRPGHEMPAVLLGGVTVSTLQRGAVIATPG